MKNTLNSQKSRMSEIRNEMVMEAQDSVETVVELIDAVHRHKLAAKTNQVALCTEVHNLKERPQKLVYKTEHYYNAKLPTYEESQRKYMRFLNVKQKRQEINQ